MEGQYANVGTAVGFDPDDTEVSDEDPSHYFGVVPSIDIEKATNGEDADTETGPEILVGEEVTWEYLVTNTGEVDLTDVSVIDDQGVTVICPGSALAVGESMTCTASGVAVEGQYANIGTAVGTDPGDNEVSDEDPSHYFGVLPATLSGMKFHDADFDGQPREADELGLAGWTIYVDYDGNGELDASEPSGVTAADGSYSITGISPGTWSVSEELSTDWICSYPSSCTHDVTFEAGDALAGGDFGNYEKSLVKLFKLTNGKLNAAVNWTFELYLGPDGFRDSVLASSSTYGDADGVLEFDGFKLDPALTYTICERNLRPAWSPLWQIDTDGDETVDTTIVPYNPDVGDPLGDLGNRCFDFGGGVGATYAIPEGGTLVFDVDNRRLPCGDPILAPPEPVFEGDHAVTATRLAGYDPDPETIAASRLAALCS
ncbi:MAG: hypothetical protein GY708_26535 [Actinomycetia bacterium]|nr:hypothetical protein [Actinomycetes bacterium]